MKHYKKLTGEKVFLSPICEADVEKCTEWLNNSYISDRLGQTGSILSEAAEKKYIENCINSGTYIFAIVTLDNGEYIGNASIEEINNIHRTATAGIFIGDEKNRGKGYGSDALRTLLDYGFNYLNLNNVMLTVFSFNEPAFRAYRKIGFSEFGRRHDAYFLNGKYYDVIYMEFLAEDYRKKYGLQN